MLCKDRKFIFIAYPFVKKMFGAPLMLGCGANGWVKMRMVDVTNLLELRVRNRKYPQMASVQVNHIGQLPPSGWSNEFLLSRTHVTFDTSLAPSRRFIPQPIITANPTPPTSKRHLSLPTR